MENPCTFLLAKEKTWKRIFHTSSELSQNRTEKQIMSSKTTINWLFNDTWCYFFIVCFDWKIGVFQQTDVRVYYILNKAESEIRLSRTQRPKYSVQRPESRVQRPESSFQSPDPSVQSPAPKTSVQSPGIPVCRLKCLLQYCLKFFLSIRRQIGVGILSQKDG